MSHKTLFNGPASIAFTTAFLLLSTAALSSPVGHRPIEFEITGRVLDADTKEPIEGAYVLAVYKIQRAGIAAVADFCVKTLGMFTGRDGEYHFPVESLDGRSPFITQAIKSGFYWQTSRFPDEAEWRKQDLTTYSNRDIYLKRQDPNKLDWHLGNREEVCDWAPTAKAAEAGVKYLELILAEYERYGRGEQQKEAVKGQIQRLRKLPQSDPAKQ